jgi:phosphatidylserine synthase
MVGLGVGPAILVFQHLQLQGISILWVTPLVIFYTMAGAFRLARFNTLPPKASSSMDSVGLTITQSGCTVTLAVLADTVNAAGFLPVLSYFPLLFLLAILMVSKISFPPSSWFFRKHKFGWFLLMFFPLLIIMLHVISTWFIYYLVYILISTGRSIVHKFKPGLQA